MAGKKFTVDALLELRSSAAQSAGTEYGDGKDIGPLGKIARAILTATSIGESATITANLQGSDDNSTFYDIPGAAFLDPADGAAIDAAGQYEVYFKTDFRYIRMKSVVANAACTWQCHVEKG
jgi:hypothetical protein